MTSLFRSLFFLLLVALSQARTTNDASIKLIKSFEGFYKNFYIDPVGIRTVGYGHACHVWNCNALIAKNAQGATRQVYTPLSEQDASDLLRNDLSAGGFENCVESSATNTLSDNQFGALVSFTFNIGCGGFKSSSVLRNINSNNFGNVRASLMLWNKGGGRVLPGLTRRRAAEADLFESGGGGGGGGTANPVGQSCLQVSSGEKGLCMASSSCTGTAVSGLCPGDSSIQCCLLQQCGSGSNAGQCKDTSRCSGNALSGLCPGDSTFKCCVGGSTSQALTSPCPTGASFDTSLGYCADATNAYGPFTKAMTDKCIQNGGGQATCTSEQSFTISGVTVKIQRWGKAFAANIRGTAACPLGAEPSSNYLGHCTETLTDGSANVFGPFSESLVELCKVAKGGSACYTVRWSAGFFRAVATGASFAIEINMENDTSVESTLDTVAGGQLDLSNDGEDSAALSFLANNSFFFFILSLSLSFFFTFKSSF